MLQNAIGGGIGIFVAYVGMLNVNLVTFTPRTPRPPARAWPPAPRLVWPR